MEDCTMDPHFNEYLAAVAGMLECYGKPTENNSFDSESCPSIKTDQTDCSSTQRTDVHRLEVHTDANNENVG